jgi:hypothetical protein
MNILEHNITSSYPEGKLLAVVTSNEEESEVTLTFFSDLDSIFSNTKFDLCLYPYVEVDSSGRYDFSAIIENINGWRKFDEIMAKVGISRVNLTDEEYVEVELHSFMMDCEDPNEAIGNCPNTEAICEMLWGNLVAQYDEVTEKMLTTGNIL